MDPREKYVVPFAPHTRAVDKQKTHGRPPRSLGRIRTIAPTLEVVLRKGEF